MQSLGARMERESYAIYWEEREGDSGPEESDISVCGEKAEVMLPVEVLKGASRAIAPNPTQHCYRSKQGRG